MIRLFHVSDVHFGREDRAAVAWFDAAVHAERPDAIVMTGDLTMRARSAEFAAATAWLEALKRPVTVEVGNHDLPAFNLFARLFRPYRRFTRLEAVIEKELDLPGVTIVPMKTTARFQLRNWSKGSVSDRSLRKAVSGVEAADKGGLVIVACHHPLIEAGTQATARTHNGRPALAALAQAGADAVLSGHVHDPFDRVVEEGGRPVRMIGAGTLSSRVRESRPSFNELRIDGRDLEVIVRTMP
ncbi:3',5'-cyclic AMP phosphodiesterase CpdA [Sphingomonas guangdongensis]|uniref:3',5'-cyclic AMP phosphodiesterase CpdA n=1 Tax=Sphingomonas guangdongensis TaxID=1141890 RepID=A0A285QB84_9SPHN|nr:metallophosphoesterase [Sphingomonas guangdongensis]SOB78699.1 3',5'-cyclic AMP phosphodiesterase CpdA [Sphingomonas guangdongensis]